MSFKIKMFITFSTIANYFINIGVSVYGERVHTRKALAKQWTEHEYETSDLRTNSG